MGSSSSSRSSHSHSSSSHSRSSRSRSHHSSLVVDGSVLEAMGAPGLLEYLTARPEHQVAGAGILQPRPGGLLRLVSPS